MARLRKEKGVEILEARDTPLSAPTSHAAEAKKRTIWQILGGLVKNTFLFLLFVYCMSLLLLNVSYSFRHQLVFLNYIVHPFLNYSDPESRGISHTTNFHIQGQDGRLGVWHVQAKASLAIDDGKPVVLYMHGNGYSRNAKHRIGMYKVLSSLGCHVVAVDYRGFGDSDGSPSEQGLIDDSLTVFKWIRTNTKHSPVYLWGHSLGAAVGVGVAKVLTESDASVMGLILEAPFNNMKEASIGHPLALPFRMLPNFSEMLQEINDLFKSDEIITAVKYPILILHDHEDKIINFSLGKKLYEAAVKGRAEDQVVEFREFRGYGHKDLFAAKELPGILRNFMKQK